MSNQAKNSDYRLKVEGTFTSMTTGDLDSLADYVADDLEYQLTGAHPFAGTFVGKDQLLGMIGAVRSNFVDGIHYNISRFIVADNTAVATFTGTGTTVNGKNYSNEYCAIYDFDESLKIAKITEFFDSHHVVSVLTPDE